MAVASHRGKDVQASRINVTLCLQPQDHRPLDPLLRVVHRRRQPQHLVAHHSVVVPGENKVRRQQRSVVCNVEGQRRGLLLSRATGVGVCSCVGRVGAILGILLVDAGLVYGSVSALVVISLLLWVAGIGAAFVVPEYYGRPLHTTLAEVEREQREEDSSDSSNQPAVLGCLK